LILLGQERRTSITIRINKVNSKRKVFLNERREAMGTTIWQFIQENALLMIGICFVVAGLCTLGVAMICYYIGAKRPHHPWVARKLK